MIMTARCGGCLHHPLARDSRPSLHAGVISPTYSNPIWAGYVTLTGDQKIATTSYRYTQSEWWVPSAKQTDSWL